MTRLRWVTLLVVAFGGCTPASGDSSTDSTHRDSRAPSCLGEATPEIEVGRVGALPLSLSVRELRQRCPDIRDTSATGNESGDTAIVISRGGLRVIGRLATTADEDGLHPFRLDSAMTIDRWTVTGRDGFLPGGVPLDAAWDSLVRAYGTPRLLPLNGNVYVFFCERLPAFVFHFDDPYYQGKGGAPPRGSARLAGAKIRSVDVPGREGLRPSPACNA